MTERKESRKTAKFDVSSRFWKIFLILLAAFLTFAGPTYVVYVLVNTLEINYVASMGSGFVLFLVGLALIWYLIKNEVIS